MNPGELQAIEGQRQALLGQLTAAETALRAGLNNTRGFGDTARAHMERARRTSPKPISPSTKAKSVRTASNSWMT